MRPLHWDGTQQLAQFGRPPAGDQPELDLGQAETVYSAVCTSKSKLLYWNPLKQQPSWADTLKQGRFCVWRTRFSPELIRITNQELYRRVNETMADVAGSGLIFRMREEDDAFPHTVLNSLCGVSPNEPSSG